VTEQSSVDAGDVSNPFLVSSSVAERHDTKGFVSNNPFMTADTSSAASNPFLADSAKNSVRTSSPAKATSETGGNPFFTASVGQRPSAEDGAEQGGESNPFLNSSASSASTRSKDAPSSLRVNPPAELPSSQSSSLRSTASQPTGDAASLAALRSPTRSFSVEEGSLQRAPRSRKYEKVVSLGSADVYLSAIPWETPYETRIIIEKNGVKAGELSLSIVQKWDKVSFLSRLAADSHIFRRNAHMLSLQDVQRAGPLRYKDPKTGDWTKLYGLIRQERQDGESVGYYHTLYLISGPIQVRIDASILASRFRFTS
jgi:hypothetical protein